MAFSLTANLLLVLSSNYIDEKKRLCNFLFIPAEFPPDDPLPHRANTNDSYAGFFLFYIWFDLEEALT